MVKVTHAALFEGSMGYFYVKSKPPLCGCYKRAFSYGTKNPPSDKIDLAGNRLSVEFFVAVGFQKF